LWEKRSGSHPPIIRGGNPLKRYFSRRKEGGITPTGVKNWGKFSRPKRGSQRGRKRRESREKRVEPPNKKEKEIYNPKKEGVKGEDIKKGPSKKRGKTMGPPKRETKGDPQRKPLIPRGKKKSFSPNLGWPKNKPRYGRNSKKDRK